MGGVLNKIKAVLRPARMLSQAGRPDLSLLTPTALLTLSGGIRTQFVYAIGGKQQRTGGAELKDLRLSLS